MSKLILLSGPSCVGKGPLVAALRYYHPDIRFGEVAVKKSLESRNVKGDFKYRDHSELTSAQTEQIRAQLRPTDDIRDFYPARTILNWASEPGNYIVGDCRGNAQAIRRVDIEAAAGSNHTVFSEVYYTLGQQFLSSPLMAGLSGVSVHSVFLSPISADDIAELTNSGIDVNQYITQLMFHKQVVRARMLGKAVETKTFMERAADAMNEISTMARFSRIIVNADGEGSHNWNQVMKGEKVVFDEESFLSGDAARALDIFTNVFFTADGDRRLWQIAWRNSGQSEPGKEDPEAAESAYLCPKPNIFFGTLEEAVARGQEILASGQPDLPYEGYYPWILPKEPER